MKLISRLVRRPIDWVPHVTGRTRELQDGEKASGALMKRWRNGRWQYRRMTEDEEDEWTSRDAW